MVRKLLKHELAALGRTLLLIEGITLAAAALLRVLQLFETDHFVYNIIFGFSVFFLVVTVVVCIVSVPIMGVVRFYRNLFTQEGYLSFTLPVTPAQHIMVKLAAAGVFSLLASVVAFGAIAIATAGDVFYELLLAVQYLLDQLLKLDGGVHILLYVLEFAVVLLTSFLAEMLFFYTCITIGQLAKKNRVLAAVGVYFGFYIVSQILSTVITILFTFFGQSIVDWLANFFITYKFTAIHLAFLLVFVITAVLGTVWFFVSHLIIRKRLNLE